MTIKILRNLGLVVIAAGLLAGSTACASDSAPNNESTSSESTAPQSSAEEAPEANNRSGVVTLAEASFQGLNGEARWEDSTLIVTLDGDAGEELEASVACGILQNFLEAGEKSRLEFPNGTVDCPST